MKKYILANKWLALGVLVINIVGSAYVAYIALIIQDLINYATDSNLDRFYSTVIFAAIYFLVLGLVIFLTRAIRETFRLKVIRRLRKDVFQGLIRQDVSQFNTVNSADYISMLTNDVQLVDDNYLQPLINIIYNVSQLILSVGLMIYLSPVVTLAVLVCIVFLVVIPNLFSSEVQKRQNRLSGSLSLFTIKIKDIFSGFEVIKSYQMEDYVDESFDERNTDEYKSKLSLGYMYAITNMVSTLISIFSRLGTVGLAAYLIAQGRLTAGALFGIIQVSTQIINPIQSLSDNIPRIRGSKEVIKRLTKFTNLAADKRTKLATFDQHISFNQFSYTYTDQDHLTIKNVCFTFEKNKKYAIVGRSGCGKTTLMRGLIGHLNDYQGRILYDDHELQEVKNTSVVSLSSLVHQSIYMFDETIEENITLHETFKKRELQRAIEDSGVFLFLDEERTLQTEVGENGANLSGGQRQRIAIARALIQNKPLLILDEGTSAIDRETARDIEQRLLRRKDLTLLTITHALEASMLEQYDEIIYMEDGSIVENGSFDDLVSKQGKFAFYMQD